MKTKPNATEFTVGKWYFGTDPPDDKRGWWCVKWENKWSDPDEDAEEQERRFRSFDAAINFGRKLIANADKYNKGEL